MRSDTKQLFDSVMAISLEHGAICDNEYRRKLEDVLAAWEGKGNAAGAADSEGYVDMECSHPSELFQRAFSLSCVKDATELAEVRELRRLLCQLCQRDFGFPSQSVLEDLLPDHFVIPMFSPMHTRTSYAEQLLDHMASLAKKGVGPEVRIAIVPDALTGFVHEREYSAARSSLLGRTICLAERLAQRYCWDAGEALAFVMGGYEPECQTARAILREAGEGQPGSMAGVVLEVHPFTSIKKVGTLYSQALSKLGRNKAKRQSDRKLRKAVEHLMLGGVPYILGRLLDEGGQDEVLQSCADPEVTRAVRNLMCRSWAPREFAEEELIATKQGCRRIQVSVLAEWESIFDAALKKAGSSLSEQMQLTAANYENASIWLAAAMHLDERFCAPWEQQAGTATEGTSFEAGFRAYMVLFIKNVFQLDLDEAVALVDGEEFRLELEELRRSIFPSW